VSVNSYGQYNIKTAQMHFDKMEYAKSASILEVIIKKNKDNQKLLQMLVDSYYYNSQMEDAYKWYPILMEKYESKVSTIEYFKYSQVLKAVNKSEDANKWFQKYKAANPDELRVQNYEKEKASLKSILEKPDKFKIKNAPFNTPYSDFSAIFYNEDIVFTSVNKDVLDGKNGEIYKRTNQPYLELYITDYEVRKSDAFGVELFSEKINKPFHDGSSSFSPDGKTIYFTRNNSKGNKLLYDKEKFSNLKIFTAKLENDKWSVPELLSINVNEYSMGHPAISPDGKKLYFTSDIPGGYGATDIYVVDVLGDGLFGEPKNLGKTINTEGREMFPFVDENNLYFSSNGHLGLGLLDIFKVDLKSDNMVPVNMGKPINSNYDDFALVYNEEINKGFLSSNRPGGVGDDDIYTFFKRISYVSGDVTEFKTGALIPGAKVVLYDEFGKELQKVTVGADAQFNFEIETEYKYKLIGSKIAFESDSKEFFSAEGKKMVVPLVLKREFVMERGKCIIKIDPIYFDFDKYDIRMDAAIELNKIVEVMKKYPELIIEGGSHTDSRGSFAYNEKLSFRRADATVQYIINKGIDSNRISAKGYGEAALVNNCADGVKCTEPEHQLNRRTEFVVTNINEIRKLYPDICGKETEVVNPLDLIDKKQK
jgi:outer membrane protein OmpA-like peptidoglycan-associated protein